ncbi:hypothetical protein KIPB_000648 [Kipferlia bialata]|uniref:Uncharacterized protein n=1 Tax=Kipferlia bialata TaxID=797122 RepID=A0A9K3CMR1_9EUKA|nr:hypothetical protein KIPB_000648 [Kipferlia bialata]|eukprot:g648.t1
MYNTSFKEAVAFLSTFSVVVMASETGTGTESAIAPLSALCRQCGVKLVVATVSGLAGRLFCDFGDKHIITDADGRRIDDHPVFTVMPNVIDGECRMFVQCTDNHELDGMDHARPLVVVMDVSRPVPEMVSSLSCLVRFHGSYLEGEAVLYRVATPPAAYFLTLMPVYRERLKEYPVFKDRESQDAFTTSVCERMHEVPDASGERGDTTTLLERCNGPMLKALLLNGADENYNPWKARCRSSLSVLDHNAAVFGHCVDPSPSLTLDPLHFTALCQHHQYISNPYKEGDPLCTYIVGRRLSMPHDRVYLVGFGEEAYEDAASFCDYLNERGVRCVDVASIEYVPDSPPDLSGVDVLVYPSAYREEPGSEGVGRSGVSCLRALAIERVPRTLYTVWCMSIYDRERLDHYTLDPEPSPVITGRCNPFHNPPRTLSTAPDSLVSLTNPNLSTLLLAYLFYSSDDMRAHMLDGPNVALSCVPVLFLHSGDSHTAKLWSICKEMVRENIASLERGDQPSAVVNELPPGSVAAGHPHMSLCQDIQESIANGTSLTTSLDVSTILPMGYSMLHRGGASVVLPPHPFEMVLYSRNTIPDYIVNVYTAVSEKKTSPWHTFYQHSPTVLVVVPDKAGERRVLHNCPQSRSLEHTGPLESWVVMRNEHRARPPVIVVRCDMHECERRVLLQWQMQRLSLDGAELGGVVYLGKECTSMAKEIATVACSFWGRDKVWSSTLPFVVSMLDECQGVWEACVGRGPYLPGHADRLSQGDSASSSLHRLGRISVDWGISRGYLRETRESVVLTPPEMAALLCHFVCIENAVAHIPKTLTTLSVPEEFVYVVVYPSDCESEAAGMVEYLSLKGAATVDISDVPVGSKGEDILKRLVRKASVFMISEDALTRANGRFAIYTLLGSLREAGRTGMDAYTGVRLMVAGEPVANGISAEFQSFLNLYLELVPGDVVQGIIDHGTLLTRIPYSHLSLDWVSGCKKRFNGPEDTLEPWGKNRWRLDIGHSANLAVYCEFESEGDSDRERAEKRRTLSHMDALADLLSRRIPSIPADNPCVILVVPCRERQDLLCKMYPQLVACEDIHLADRPSCIVVRADMDNEVLRRHLEWAFHVTHMFDLSPETESPVVGVVTYPSILLPPCLLSSIQYGATWTAESNSAVVSGCINKTLYGVIASSDVVADRYERFCSAMGGKVHDNYIPHMSEVPRRPHCKQFGMVSYQYLLETRKTIDLTPPHFYALVTHHLLVHHSARHMPKPVESYTMPETDVYLLALGKGPYSEVKEWCAKIGGMGVGCLDVSTFKTDKAMMNRAGRKAISRSSVLVCSLSDIQGHGTRRSALVSRLLDILGSDTRGLRVVLGPGGVREAGGIKYSPITKRLQRHVDAYRKSMASMDEDDREYKESIIVGGDLLVQLPVGQGDRSLPVFFEGFQPTVYVQPVVDTGADADDVSYREVVECTTQSEEVPPMPVCITGGQEKESVPAVSGLIPPDAAEGRSVADASVESEAGGETVSGPVSSMGAPVVVADTTGETLAVAQSLPGPSPTREIETGDTTLAETSYDDAPSSVGVCESSVCPSSSDLPPWMQPTADAPSVTVHGGDAGASDSFDSLGTLDWMQDDWGMGDMSLDLDCCEGSEAVTEVDVLDEVIVEGPEDDNPLSLSQKEVGGEDGTGDRTTEPVRSEPLRGADRTSLPPTGPLVSAPASLPTTSVAPPLALPTPATTLPPAASSGARAPDAKPPLPLPVSMLPLPVYMHTTSQTQDVAPLPLPLPMPLPMVPSLPSTEAPLDVQADVDGGFASFSCVPTEDMYAELVCQLDPQDEREREGGYGVEAVIVADVSREEGLFCVRSALEDEDAGSDVTVGAFPLTGHPLRPDPSVLLVCMDKGSLTGGGTTAKLARLLMDCTLAVVPQKVSPVIAEALCRVYLPDLNLVVYGDTTPTSQERQRMCGQWYQTLLDTSAPEELTDIPAEGEQIDDKGAKKRSKRKGKGKGIVPQDTPEMQSLLSSLHLGSSADAAFILPDDTTYIGNSTLRVMDLDDVCPQIEGDQFGEAEREREARYEEVMALLTERLAQRTESGTLPSTNVSKCVYSVADMMRWKGRPGCVAEPTSLVSAQDRQSLLALSRRCNWNKKM